MTAQPSIFQVIAALEKSGAVLEALDGDVNCSWPNGDMAKVCGGWVSMHRDVVYTILTWRDLYRRDSNVALMRHA